MDTLIEKIRENNGIITFNKDKAKEILEIGLDEELDKLNISEELLK